MSKVSEVISKLQELIDKHGDRECVIYKSFDKDTTNVRDDQIFFSSKDKNIYIGIYN